MKKTSQIDMFGVAEESSIPPVALKKKRRRREVKKAPMIMDSYAQCEKDVIARSPAKRDDEAISNNGIASPRGLAMTPQPSTSPRIYTVSELTDGIKKVVEGAFQDVWITGEVTDFKNKTGSRHYYFALKDEKSRIRMVIFGAVGRLKFELADGMEVVCHGKLDVYPPQGSYSIVADYIEPKGIGALQLAFEQLKKKLQAEGLFDASRKRKLPFLPGRIGVVTSPTGAVIRDIINVVKRRNPSVGILLHPVRVQGEGADMEIAQAIKVMNGLAGLDLLIVGRGGGSIEDLWAFNEEVVARAIAASRLPVISAVGHEVDFTIADFVADVRAPTPSAAAELAVPVRAELLKDMSEHRGRFCRALKQKVELLKRELARCEARLQDPRRRLPDLMIRIDHVRERMVFAMRTLLERRVQHVRKLKEGLAHLSPTEILGKGYAVVEGPDGKAVTEGARLKKGDDIKLRFHKGLAEARVTKVVDGVE